MKMNIEKAPVAANEQGAQEINQVQDKAKPAQSQEIISELIRLARRMKELYDTRGVLRVGCCGDVSIQMGDEFFDLFDFGEYIQDYTPDYDRYFTRIDGVEFFCLADKEKPCTDV